MATKSALVQNSRFKAGWIILLVIAGLMTMAHFSLIFIQDEPNLFVGFTLFTLYALHVLWIPFRRGETWAWLATWLLPIGLAILAATDANIRVYYFGAAAVCVLGLLLTMRNFFAVKRVSGAVALAITVLVSTLSPQPAYAQGTLVVDDDGQASAGNCSSEAAAFSSIQAAVDAAVPGDTIFICAGIYNEQVVVHTSNLIILGSGKDAAIIRPSVVSANSIGTSIPFPVAPILLVKEATGVTVKDLTVDGSLAGNGAANLDCRDVGFYMGIYYRNSSGNIEATHITNIRSSTACSAGLSLWSDREHVSTLVVKDNLLTNYGSEGLRCSGPYAACNVTGNMFQGRGPVSDQIQGGIIFHRGAGGEISGNTILDHYYTPAVGIYEFSVGIALFNAEPDLNPHLFQENTFSGNQMNVQRLGTAQTFE